MITVSKWVLIWTALVFFWFGFVVGMPSTKFKASDPYATDFRLSVRVTDGRTIPLSYSDAKTRDDAYERMKHLGQDQFYEGGQDKEWRFFIRGYAIVSVEKIYP